MAEPIDQIGSVQFSYISMYAP